MRLVTTCTEQQLDDYGYRWLDSRKNWPEGTQFHWYTEGYTLDEPGLVTRDFGDLPEFSAWKAKHSGYVPPGWQWNVVGFSHKVFAACDALYDYDGIGVWLDADCVTYKPIPGYLIPAELDDAYLAHYFRQGMYTETGLWIIDCAHPEHRNFLDSWRAWYFTEAYKRLPQFHDCFTFDATLRSFVRANRIKTRSLSGEFAKDMHPQAKTVFGAYIDHKKGGRKAMQFSPENKYHEAFVKGGEACVMTN